MSQAAMREGHWDSSAMRWLSRRLVARDGWLRPRPHCTRSRCLVFVGRDLHRGMRCDLGPLPVDPVRPLAGLAVWDALQMPAEPAANLGEGRVGIQIGQAACQGSPNNPHLGHRKFPTLRIEGGVDMNEFQQGARDTDTSLAHWAEDSRMVGRERWEEFHRAHSVEGLSVSGILLVSVAGNCLANPPTRPRKRKPTPSGNIRTSGPLV